MMNTPEHTYNYKTKAPYQGPWLIVDIETTGRDDVAHLLEEPEANKTLKDPAKIEADIAAKKAAQLEKLPLDFNLNQIVTIGAMADNWATPKVLMPHTSSEQACLKALWQEWCVEEYGRQRTFIGFNVRHFDLPTLVQRTRLLGMPEPDIDYGRWSKDIIDLAEVLSFGDPKYAPGKKAVRRKLKMFCTLFGIPQADDDCDGADVPELIKAGKFDEVEKHCAADILRTRDLAVRLGVIS